MAFLPVKKEMTFNGPTPLEVYPDRKATWFLRSEKQGGYKPKVMVSGWHENRETYPRDYNITTAPEFSCHKSTYWNLGSNREPWPDPTTRAVLEEGITQIRDLRDYSRARLANMLSTAHRAGKKIYGCDPYLTEPLDNTPSSISSIRDEKYPYITEMKDRYRVHPNKYPKKNIKNQCDNLVSSECDWVFRRGFPQVSVFPTANGAMKYTDDYLFDPVTPIFRVKSEWWWPICPITGRSLGRKIKVHRDTPEACKDVPITTFGGKVQ